MMLEISPPLTASSADWCQDSGPKPRPLLRRSSQPGAGIKNELFSLILQAAGSAVVVVAAAAAAAADNDAFMGRRKIKAVIGAAA